MMGDMNMKKIILALAVISLGLVSCSELTGNKSDDYRTFTAYADQGASTKTSLSSDLQTLWSASDAITVFPGQGSGVTFSDVTVSGGGLHAEFSGSIPLSSAYFALYPAQQDAAMGYDDSIYAVLPTVQQAVPGGFAEGASIAVARTASDDLHFKNVGAYVSLTVNSTDVVSVKLSGTSGVKGMTGKAYIAIDEDGIPSASCKVADEGVEYVELTGGLTKGAKHYLVIYPGTYSNLRITFTDSKGRTASYSNSTALTIGRNENYNLGSFTIPESKWDGGESVGSEWSLVKDASTLAPGDKLVIGTDTYGMVAGNISNQILPNLEASFTADGSAITDLPSGALILTLGGTRDAWTFADPSGKLLGATTVKKLAWDSGTTTWKITIDGNGNASIANTNSSYGILYYNASSPRFTTYTSTQKPVKIYRGARGEAQSSVSTSSTVNGLTSSSATLSGSYVSVSGTPSEVGFKYGVSKTGLYNTIKSTASGSSASFSSTLSNLESSTTYYFQAYAVIDGVTFLGQVQAFTTKSGSGGLTSSDGVPGWFEMPVIKDEDNNRIDDDDKTLYYAYHLCAGGEKGPTGSTARNYSVCYSSKYHCPVWVAAPRHSMYIGSSGRNDSYRADPDIPSSIQLSSKDTGGGCNKGHMLGSADRTSSASTNRQVFYYSNIAPQNSTTFNTGGGAWNNLEDFVDGLVVRDTLYEVVGCYFKDFQDNRGSSLSRPSTISFGGRSDVAKPTMFYYALLRTKKGNTGKSVTKCSADELQCVAFVVSHTAAKGNKPSAQDLISISALEELTGFTYFPNVPNAPKSTFNASDWGL